MLDKIVALVSDALYSYVLIILLVAGGIYFTFRTKFAQFRLFNEQLRAVTEKPSDKKGVSSFQALIRFPCRHRQYYRCIYCSLSWRLWLGFLDVADCHHWRCFGID